jgi:hypothetical protein
MKNIKYFNLIEFVLLLSVFLATFLVDLEKPRFRFDENMWINQSSHFEDFFSGKFYAFEEQDRFLALTMPTIPEYVIGLSRRIGGYRPSQLNKLWDWKKTYAENKAEGHVPSNRLLWWSRFLPSLLSVATILITFYLIKFSFSARVGYLWIILTLVNPWIIYALQGAMGESPLLANIVFAMLAGCFAIQSFKTDIRSNWVSLFWLAVFGIFTGLAGQTKTNGLAIFPAGIIILILLTTRCQPNRRWQFFLSGLVGLNIFTFIFFIGTNPFLWPDPIGRTILTMQYRVEIMHGMQAKAFPKIVIKSWNDGLQIAAEQIFKKLSSVQFINSEYLKMVLSGFGFIILLTTAWQSLRTKMFASINAGALSILIVGFFASVPNLFTPLNIDRYYLLPLYFVSILIALGFDWFLRYIISIKQNSSISTQPGIQPEA